MDIIKYKYIFISISAILVIVSVIFITIFGFKQGIDFSGGTMWQVRCPLSCGLEDLNVIQENLPKEVVITPVGGQDLSLRLPELSEEDHQKYLAVLSEKGFQELSFESIGPSIGNEIKRKSIWAFLWVIIGISLYIAFAFRKVSRPVSSWKYGIITLITLFHDALIPAGLMSVLGYLYGAEIGVNFIVAVLVVMGFSVHDTIVVFDRVRENLRLGVGSETSFSDLVNLSVIQTFARSINTSLTLILVLLALYFLGASSLGYFILIILVGVAVGTYSSIFIASPLLVLVGSKKDLANKNLT